MKLAIAAALRSHRIFLWIALGTALLLLVPLTIEPFIASMNWGSEDFMAMGLLLFTSASLFVLVARRLAFKYLGIAAVVFAVLFVYVWAELAVGIFTNIGS